MFASSLLLLLAVQWKPVVDAAPVFTPVPTLVPVSETNNETKQESTASSTPRWQRLEPPTNGSATSNPVRWAQAPTSPEPTPTPIKPQQPPKPQAIARSVGRAFSYGGVLYPEVGFWVPTAFRQDVARRFSITYGYRGSPGDKSCSGIRTPIQSPSCTDTFWFAEATPLIVGPISLGINYSQQESVINSDTNAKYGLSGSEGLGGAVGFQLKSNLNSTTGLAALGVNLLGYDTGPIGSNRLQPGEKWAADLGQGYLFIASKVLPLGNLFNFDNPAILSASAGIGNGRYKTNFREAVNYGQFGFIGNIGLSLNNHFSLFAEYAGQFAGVGVSLRPFGSIPLAATILYRDWAGLSQLGQNYNVNCPPDGKPSSCSGTIDGRLTFYF